VDSELEVIRTDMEVTRDSLAAKIGELESQVRDTVSGAGEAVAATKEGVMEVVSSVSDTVTSVKDSIKETFDLRKQVEEHPWGAFGVAIAAGATGAFLLGSPKPVSRPVNGFVPPSPNHTPFSPASAATAAPEEPSVLGSVVSKLQALAVASLVDYVQDQIRQSAPEPWKAGLQDIVRDLSSQFTGDKKPTF
jgi:ElaB/YqjD/DUF883 family membrane-anchored ribosome-binding protein